MANKNRLLYVLRLLLEETDDLHGLTREEIEAALLRQGIEVNRKTVYDDIAALEAFGIAVEKRKQQKETRYHVVGREFELPELKLLVDAVQSSKFITKKKSDGLIRKLERLASRYEGQQLQRQVYVSDRIKTENESIYYGVDAIHTAIGGGKKISFDYFHWTVEKKKAYRNGGARYVVSPLALVWEDENYYLIAYNASRGMIRHYRVDKMEKIEIMDETRDTLSAPFDAASYTNRTFGMYGGEEALVTIRCAEALAGVVIDRFGRDTHFDRVDDSHFEFRARVHVSPQFFSWVLGLGNQAEIVAPDSVREKFRTELSETLALYGENG